jgi:hypothetical protein
VILITKSAIYTAYGNAATYLNSSVTSIVVHHSVKHILRLSDVKVVIYSVFIDRIKFIVSFNFCLISFINTAMLKCVVQKPFQANTYPYGAEAVVIHMYKLTEIIMISTTGFFKAPFDDSLRFTLHFLCL